MPIDPLVTNAHPNGSRHSTRVCEPSISLTYFHYFYVFASLHEPRSFCEASSHPSCQNSITRELQALTKNHT